MQPDKCEREQGPASVMPVGDGVRVTRRDVVLHHDASRIDELPCGMPFASLVVVMHH